MTFENGVVLLDTLRELGRKNVRAHEVTHTKTGPRGFVGVGGTDAAFGGTDFLLPFCTSRNSSRERW